MHRAAEAALAAVALAAVVRVVMAGADPAAHVRALVRAATTHAAVVMREPAETTAAAATRGSNCNHMTLSIGRITTILAGLLILIGVTYVIFFRNVDRPENISKINNAVGSALDGQYDNAIAEATEISKAPPTANYLLSADTITSVLSAWTATSSEDKIAAISEAKKRFSNAQGSTYNQAWAVNTLAMIGYGSRDTAVIDAIFEGDPFSSFKVATDTALSLKKLTDYSVALAPTYYGTQLSARWYSDNLLSMVSRGHVNTAAAAEDKKQILQRLAQAADLYPKEIGVSRSSPFGVAMPSWFHYWNGYYYGIISLYDATALPSAEAELVLSAKNYDTKLDANGRHLALLEDPTLYADLAFARFVHQVGGAKRDKDVTQHLEHFVTLLHSSAVDHAGVRAYLKAQAYANPVYTQFGTLSPSFQALLTELAGGR